ncbi:MAG TPA: desulfoferrodoxin [Ruminococcaceae bacterium]|jgi:superoxide reductase|nr:desulfoferrodoxin [Oscillospiraceae bacterium]HCA71580.1 desulfoferrodoxin [Oscillospiraceae bacterium]HCC01718.1 desulfoferrodoxin [Oscillospiraceae bacterium]
MSVVDFYRCERCGNLVALIRNGGGTLSCCGQAMTKLEANSTDAAQEKHVPVITKEDGKIKVQVGSVAHPMLAKHYIEWIALVTDNQVKFKFLKPGEEPKADFDGAESGTVYAYCNLHGLWKADF